MRARPRLVRRLGLALMVGVLVAVVVAVGARGLAGRSLEWRAVASDLVPVASSVVAVAIVLAWRSRGDDETG